MFSTSAFSKASFSFHSFKMAQEDQARSGYWRLFFYNLQAEALKKDEQEQREETSQGKSERTKKAPLVFKPAPKPRTRPERAPATEETPPFPLRAVYRAPAPAPDITPYLNVLSSEFKGWLMRSEPMLQRKAANDAEMEEEEEIELLLLVA